MRIRQQIRIFTGIGASSCLTWKYTKDVRLSDPMVCWHSLMSQEVAVSPWSGVENTRALSFQFPIEARTRREAADSAVARQGEATKLSFLLGIGINRCNRIFRWAAQSCGSCKKTRGIHARKCSQARSVTKVCTNVCANFDKLSPNEN